MCVCQYILHVLQTPQGTGEDTISPFLCQNILIISSSKYSGSVTKELTLMHVLIKLQTFKMRLTKILRKGWQLILHSILHLIQVSVIIEYFITLMSSRRTFMMLCVNEHLCMCVKNTVQNLFFMQIKAFYYVSIDWSTKGKAALRNNNKSNNFSTWKCWISDWKLNQRHEIIALLVFPRGSSKEIYIRFK